MLFKMLRLFRFRKVLALLNESKMRELLKRVFNGAPRQAQVVYVHICIIVFRVVVLALEGLIITYFLGCTWWIISDRGNNTDITFINNFELASETSLRKLVISCYFSLTTLSTVGYGDYYPISNLE
jgi:hypothetical protein